MPVFFALEYQTRSTLAEAEASGLQVSPRVALQQPYSPGSMQAGWPLRAGSTLACSKGITVRLGLYNGKIVRK